MTPEQEEYRKRLLRKSAKPRKPYVRESVEQKPTPNLTKLLEDGKRYWAQVDIFMNAEDSIHIRDFLITKGIKEPYASNVLHRLFIQAYKAIKSKK